MPLPIANGMLSLQASGIQTAPKRAMIVRMTEETLKALEAYPAHPQMEFDFGDKPGVHIGSAFFPMRTVAESAPHELYLRSAPANKPNAPLKLYAMITGKIAVERELDPSISGKVRESTVEAAKAKNGRRIVVLDTPPTVQPKSKAATAVKKRKAPNTGFPAVVTKRVTQVIQAKNEGSRGISPLPPPRTNPEDFTTSRSRMIHCLAIQQRTADEIIRLVGGPDLSPSAHKQLLDLLEDIAVQVPALKKAAPTPVPAKYQLKTSTWTEVRPYGWPKLADSERTILARQARLAFNQLQIPESDPRWDHVRYRASGNALPSTSSSGNSTPNGRGGTKTDPKRAAVSDTKPKASSSTIFKAKDDSLRVPSTSASRTKKEEPPLRSSKPSLKRDRDPEDDAAASSSTSAVVQRRLPGSGVKSTRDSPALSSGSGTPTASSSLPKKPGHVDVKMRKDNSTPTGRASLNASAALRERDRDSNTSRDMPPPPKRVKEDTREREGSSAVPGGSIKRKKPAHRDDVDEELEDAVGASSNVGAKRRKLDDGSMATPAVVKNAREKERDRAAAEKDDKDAANALRKAAMKDRETKREREVSPLPKKPLAPRERAREAPRESPVPRKVKREPSPTPTPPPRAAERAREREREFERPKTKANGSSRRRRSPIYTDSEDETTATPPARSATGRANNPPSSSATSSNTSSPDALGTVPARLPPSGPLPREHRALRQRYRASYKEYVKTYNAIVEQRTRIQDVLEGSGDEGASDGELLPEDEIVSLREQHLKWKDDCLRILKAWPGAADESY